MVYFGETLVDFGKTLVDFGKTLVPALPEGLARNGGYQAIDLDAGSILSRGVL